jgi:hypothetical protein
VCPHHATVFFSGLPGYAKEYVYTRISDVLNGRDQGTGYAHISTDERRTLHEILGATKPDFAAFERKRLAPPM